MFLLSQQGFAHVYASLYDNVFPNLRIGGEGCICLDNMHEFAFSSVVRLDLRPERPQVEERLQRVYLSFISAM